MTKSLSGTTDKKTDPSEGFMAEDTDSTDFDSAEDAAPPRPTQKDPAIRRKIEDRLERKRLREELGIYDDDPLEDI
jgi:uncharacterized protein YjiS (DUF1127 family)